jgi:hypothetical protein
MGKTGKLTARNDDARVSDERRVETEEPRPRKPEPRQHFSASCKDQLQHTTNTDHGQGRRARKLNIMQFLEHLEIDHTQDQITNRPGWTVNELFVKFYEGRAR